MWQTQIHWPAMTLSLGLSAVLLSLLVGSVTCLGTYRSMRDCELVPGRWPIYFGSLGSLLTLAFGAVVFAFDCQQTPAVRPSAVSESLRMVYHLSLISLLLMITATDLKSYYILTWTCWMGMLIGVLGAAASGELQLMHVWIDWNAEVPQLRGPFIPQWLADHQHLHGIAWSVVGLVTGSLLAWLTKLISSYVLHMQTLGTGDIYLMAMIGAYLGWQPTIIAFVLAPLFAVVIGGGFAVVSNRPALPYGPFLALGAVVVLFSWRWIWMLEVPLTMAPNPDRDSIFAVRRFFGDWQLMLIAGGLAIGLFVVLLGLLRIYKSIAVRTE